MGDRKVMSRAHYDKLAASYDQHPHASYLAKLSPRSLPRRALGAATRCWTSVAAREAC